MILVAGATGVLGGAVTRKLLARGDEVRILVRPASDYRPLEALGADVAFGDLKDPASLPGALPGVERVVATANSAKRGGSDTVEAVDLRGNRALIDAARAAGVTQFLFVSASIADPDSPAPFLAAKAHTERHLKASGMPYTILKPEAFMEDWIGFVIGGQLARGNRVTLMGEGTTPQAFIAVRDVAELVVAALGNPAALDREIRVAAEIATYREVVAAFERARATPVEIRTVAPGEPIPELPEHVTQIWAGMEFGPAREFGTPDAVRALGVQPTPIAEFVRQQHA